MSSQGLLTVVCTQLALCSRQLLLPYFRITTHSKTQFRRASIYFLAHRTAVCFRCQASYVWRQLRVSFHLIHLSHSRLRLTRAMGIWSTHFSERPGKLLILPTFHQPKLITWPRPTSVERGKIPLSPGAPRGPIAERWSEEDLRAII